MQLLFSIIVWAIFGISTSYVAKQRGRDPVIWFFIGLLLGIIGLILVFVLPSVEPKEESAYPAESQTDQQAPVEADEGAELLPAEYLEGQWFYLTEEREQIGPLHLEEMENKWREGVIQNDAYVWCEKMPEWKKLRTLNIFHR